MSERPEGELSDDELLEDAWDEVAENEGRACKVCGIPITKKDCKDGCLEESDGLCRFCRSDKAEAQEDEVEVDDLFDGGGWLIFLEDPGELDECDGSEWMRDLYDELDEKVRPSNTDPETGGQL